MLTVIWRRSGPLLAAVALLTAIPCRVGAQSGPPVHGTIALEGTMQKVYRATNVIVVATVEGVQHAFRFTKELFVPGANGPDPFEGLNEGAAVVIHYRYVGSDAEALEIDPIGDGGLAVTEGKVSHVDRRRRQITIRYDNGRTERLELTEHAATGLAEVGGDVDGARITAYYRTEDGRKVVHYFRRAKS